MLRITDHAACAPEKIKDILQVETQLAGTESKLTALALWMRDRYGSTAVQALRTVLPVREQAPPKKKRQLVLTVSREKATGQLAVFRQKHQVARARLLEALIETPVLPMELVTGKPEGDSIRMAPDGRDGTADLRDGADLPDACGAQGAAKSDAAAFRFE